MEKALDTEENKTKPNKGNNFFLIGHKSNDIKENKSIPSKLEDDKTY